MNKGSQDQANRLKEEVGQGREPKETANKGLTVEQYNDL
jgi:hypothetical protein